MKDCIWLMKNLNANPGIVIQQTEHRIDIESGKVQGIIGIGTGSRDRAKR